MSEEDKELPEETAAATEEVKNEEMPPMGAPGEDRPPVEETPEGRPPMPPHGHKPPMGGHPPVPPHGGKHGPQPPMGEKPELPVENDTPAETEAEADAV